MIKDVVKAINIGLEMIINERRKRIIKFRKHRLQRRTRIFNRWLKINFNNPWTIVLAIVFPFLQAFMASVVSIYTNMSDNSVGSNFSLFGFAAIYYLSFAMNSKRATKGSWLGLILLIFFGALGIVCGKLFLNYIN